VNAYLIAEPTFIGPCISAKKFAIFLDFAPIHFVLAAEDDVERFLIAKTSGSFEVIYNSVSMA
jgi:hypothetical protein